MAEVKLLTMLCEKSRQISTRTPSMSALHAEEAKKLHHVKVLQGLMPGKVPELCLMHLSRLLDLDGDKFQALAMKSKTPCRKPFLGSPFRRKHKAESFVEGVTAESISQIYKLITFLSKPQVIKEEGLFRKTGNICRQRFLKEWLLTESESEDLSQGGCGSGPVTAHDCANVLKTLLAELPEPLLIRRHFEAYRQANDFKARGFSDAAQRQLKVIQLLMLMLPQENVVVMELLMSLLYQVCNEPSNKMTATALATMFAPHLMCSRKAFLDVSRQWLSVSSAQGIATLVYFGRVDPLRKGHQSQRDTFRWSQRCPLQTGFAASSACRTKAPTHKHYLLDGTEFHKEAAMATETVIFMIEHAPDLFKVPVELDHDIQTYLHSLKAESDDGQLTPLSTPKGKGESPVCTVVTYACRAKNEDFNPESDTQLALAQLYAHMQSMPECAQKKKLLRKFNHTVLTPPNKGRRTRSKSLGSSLKKLTQTSGLTQHKHLLSSNSDDPSPWKLKPLDAEEQVTDGATIITCKSTAATGAATSIRCCSYADDEAASSGQGVEMSSPRGRRRKHQQQSEGRECTPPKQDCKEEAWLETAAACGPRTKDMPSRRKQRESPLPCSENEITYLHVNLHQDKLPLPVHQGEISAVKLCNRTIGRSPKDHCRRAQSMVFSPTTLETSL